MKSSGFESDLSCFLTILFINMEMPLMDEILKIVIKVYKIQPCGSIPEMKKKNRSRERKVPI